MRARFWLVLSVALNVLLAIGLVIAKKPGEQEMDSDSPAPTVLVKTNVVVRQENFTWDQIRSTNYATLITNLRAIGCPEQVIRDLVVSDINRIYATRRLTEVNFPNFQWWKSNPDPALTKAAEDKLQALESERRDLLTGLLGQGWDAESKEAIAARGGITLTGPLLGELSPSAKQAILDIVAAAQLKIDAYQQQQRLAGAAVDPMQMVRLREEPLTALASVMEPAPYDEFLLRYSPAAQQLRDMMKTMTLTPDQFSALYNALSGIIGQPVFFYSGSDPALAKQQQQLATQSEAVIKTILGEAYATYQLNQDPVYQNTQALAQQLSLPAKMIVPLYQISRASQAEMDRIRSDDTLSNDEKIQALSQTRVEEEQTVEQLLGPDAFERWLESQEK